MSGIATYTRNIADLLKGSKTKLLDTRKTTPGMRIFEKYAVSMLMWQQWLRLLNTDLI